MTAIDSTKLDTAISFLPREMELRLRVRDREVVETLGDLDEGTEREDYAVTALRIGVMAMRKARGEVDTQRLRNEGDRLLQEMREVLSNRAVEMSSAMQETLRRYLDPESGLFPQRVESLVADDGELARVLRQHVSGSDSEVARTLAEQVGNKSDLFRLLDPEHQGSLLAQLTVALEGGVRAQREQVLREFSLDNREGALARLLAELTDHQGRLRGEFQEDLTKVVGEFSLDDENSALSRLVARVDHAQRGIVEQFSLDDERSALSRLRKELMSTFEVMVQKQTAFQAEMGQLMASLQARKKAEGRSTTHGVTFEDQLGELLETEANRQGDLYDAVGTTTGALRHCKVGDHVITVGPDQMAADARIVFEAKANKAVSDSDALKELRQAKENREADVGVFVFSKSAVSDQKEPFRRVGDDLLVVWDPDDVSTDIYVQVALSVAKALVHNAALAGDHDDVDLASMDAAVAEISRQVERLDGMTKSTSTIRNGADKLDQQIGAMRKVLEKEVERLRAGVESVREAL